MGVSMPEGVQLSIVAQLDEDQEAGMKRGISHLFRLSIKVIRQWKCLELPKKITFQLFEIKS